MGVLAWGTLAVAVVLVLVAVHDLVQTRHSILRNFPLVGHLRFVLESFGPELRQYIVAADDDEGPFTRDERSWIYATAKGDNPYQGFGTDNVITRDGYLVLLHAAFPHPETAGDEGPHHLPFARPLGDAHGRPGAFTPASFVNISAMSFGSLSGRAVEALNRAAAAAGCLHNTGEGGISPHHLHGGELVYQVGTGYFGCRDPEGRFDLDRLCATVASGPVRAVEIKLSQGAKPGLGGVLPGVKVTPEIAAARGVPVGVTVHSPNHHRAFDDVAGLVAFVERIADATGLPVGIKSAVGEAAFWDELFAHMAATGRGPDFVTVDGGEGGTGAGPLSFTDHVALPLRDALALVAAARRRHGLDATVALIASGRLGLAHNAVAAAALGADGVNVAREAMFAIGCIQAQRCHNGHCPTGVATQNRWL
ncbi:MAG: FMN-binding glutamate synthase family protein, partial [Actinomyces sp.]